MLDLSVIILTYNEELHIKRAIDNVYDIVKEIFIIDSYSTDRTIEIAKRYSKVHILQHKWENNYSKQFNWGLNNAPIKTEWVMRLDADEYLTNELIVELKDKLPSISKEISGITVNRRYYFMGKWMKRGIYPVKLMRIFKYRKAFCEERLMDEHIQLIEGDNIDFRNDIVDENLNDLSWACHKHINYAVREAADLLDIEYNITEVALNDKNRYISDQAKKKRNMKHRYAKSPLFLRAFLYFLYRYILRGGILDGKVGFIFNFVGALWYRTFVDVKIIEIKKACGDNPELIRDYLSKHYNLTFDFSSK